MPDVSQLALFLSGAFIIIVIPGPNILFLVARSIHQGRLAGFVSVLGIEAATVVHICAAAVGLTSLLMTSALAFSVVKYAGAAYLIYLGVRKLVEKDHGAQSGPVKAERLQSIFIQGFVVNLLNPKTALFFLAFLPQFVAVGPGTPKLQILFLGLILIVLAFAVETAYVLFSSRLSAWFDDRRKDRIYQRRLAGGVYIGLGLTTAFTGAKQR